LSDAETTKAERLDAIHDLYTLVVCALLVLLLFLYDWFFRNHPGG
jgi:hypothetical protein